MDADGSRERGEPLAVSLLSPGWKKGRHYTRGLERNAVHTENYTFTSLLSLDPSHENVEMRRKRKLSQREETRPGTSTREAEAEARSNACRGGRPGTRGHGEGKEKRGKETKGSKGKGREDMKNEVNKGGGGKKHETIDKKGRKEREGTGKKGER